MSNKKVLILGGTAEAAELATILHDQGINVTVSLAGRTREPAPLKANTRIGGFGGSAGLATYIKENHIEFLVDMTHPFATNISNNAQEAAKITGVKFIAWQRPGWQPMGGDKWHSVPTLTAAMSSIPAGARALLALGSQHITPFAARADVHFLVRMIDPPGSPLLLPNHTLLLGKPGSVEAEYATLVDHKITHIVCRNSGGKASYTKIAAARLLGLPVIMIGQQTEGTANTSLNEVLEKISACLT